MKRSPTRAFAVALFASLPVVAPRAAAQDAVLEGRILDGAASAAAFSTQARGEEWYVPMADQEVSIDLLSTERGWTVRTDGEGRFRLDLKAAALPRGARLVARCERGGARLYSPTFAPAPSSVDVFVYPTTESPENVTCELAVAHDTIVGGGANRLFRVRLSVSFSNRGATLYVGRRQRSVWREIFRVPVPPGATVTQSSGPIPGLEWKASDDGRWRIIDDPVPGFADIVLQFKKGARWSWDLTYVVPARQEMAFNYFFPMRGMRVVMYALKDQIGLVSPELSQPTAIPKDPFTQEPRKFDAYGLGGGHSSFKDVGSQLLVGVHVDNAAIGQISCRAIKWHGAFVLVAVLAMLLGLILSPRKPPPEAMLSGLSQEEVLDRIAALDKRFESARIAEKDYRRYREALVEIAAEDLQASEGAEAKAGEAAPRVPDSLEPFLNRLRELDAAGATSPEAIHERAHLLEALYKKLNEESTR